MKIARYSQLVDRNVSAALRSFEDLSLDHMEEANRDLDRRILPREQALGLHQPRVGAAARLAEDARIDATERPALLVLAR